MSKGKAGRVYRLTPKAMRAMPIAERFIREFEAVTKDWSLENFAKFWVDIEYEEAMKLKVISFYPPCECGSSTCPECNPNGFDGEDYDDDDYEPWMDYI